MLNWRLSTFLLPLPDSSLRHSEAIRQSFFGTGDFRRLFDGVFHMHKTSISSHQWQA